MKKALALFLVIISLTAVVFGTTSCSSKPLSIVSDVFGTEHYYFPVGTAEISESSFSNKEFLKGVTIPTSVMKIGSKAFAGCTNLTTIIFAKGSNLKIVDSRAFADLKAIEEIVLPEGVTTIEWRAFSGCTALTELSIPSSITYIADDAFPGCTSLTYNEYAGASYLGNDENPYLVLVKFNDTEASTATIHKDTKIIYGSSFFGCHNITSIEIPAGVVQIGGNTFYHCSGLTSIVFGGNADQWSAVTKGGSWDYDTGAYTVTYKK